MSKGGKTEVLKLKSIFGELECHKINNDIFQLANAILRVCFESKVHFISDGVKRLVIKLMFRRLCNKYSHTRLN
jgi:hypothetical protein